MTPSLTTSSSTGCLATHPHANNGLFAPICENLHLRYGVDVNHQLLEQDPGLALFEILQKYNLRLVIIVDELDQLYQAEPGNFPRLHDVLANLTRLGDQKSGRAFTVMCGSSAHLPSLIRAEKNPASLAAFPMLDGAPDLNGDKFKTKGISSSLPTDLEIVC